VWSLIRSTHWNPQEERQPGLCGESVIHLLKGAGEQAQTLNAQFPTIYVVKCDRVLQPCLFKIAHLLTCGLGRVL
jgi:hypothetical protein